MDSLKCLTLLFYPLEENEEGEEQYWPTGDENYNVQTEEDMATASTSLMEQNTEIDAKLADFFKVTKFLPFFACSWYKPVAGYFC